MRILVTGSRTWDDWETIFEALTEHSQDIPRDTLVHGSCSGADEMAHEAWQLIGGQPPEKHPADWGSYGKAAGYIRNRKMVELGADICLAFIKAKSRGATMCSQLAIQHNILTVRYIVD